jgi:hypothetical protein
LRIAARWRRTALLLMLIGGAAGCVSTTVRTVDMSQPKSATAQVPESLLLDVGVAAFDANIPDDYDEQIEQHISPDVRRAEGVYIAYVLKNTLQDTGNWGAVRVVPRPTNAVDVNVKGAILASDGARLKVDATVTDASGKEWFTRTYEALASKYAYDPSVPPDIDPFQSIYRQIADDMLAYRQQLNAADVSRIRTVAEMKFAKEFAPDAFSSYIGTNKQGQVVVKRLPASDDPMLVRVRKVREREYAFIDTLDEYYAEFDRTMHKPYQDWRSATYTEAIAYRQLQSQARTRMLVGSAALVGGVAAEFRGDSDTTKMAGWGSVLTGAMLMKSALNKRAEAEIHSEVLQELGASAEAEIAPHTLELENETVRLTGTVDQQYATLRRILKQAYYEELGLPVPDTPDAAGAPGKTSASPSDS